MDYAEALGIFYTPTPDHVGTPPASSNRT